MYPTILHEWFHEVWNRGDTNAVPRLLAADAMLYNLDQEGNDYRGPDQFLEFFERYRGAFPDLEIIVEDVIQAGDALAARWSVKGTHRGAHLGFGPTGAPVRLGGMTFCKVRNGKIVEGWNLFDSASMMKQLGFTLTPPKA